MIISTVRSRHLVPVILLCLPTIPWRSEEQQPQPSVAGTYHVAVCKRQPCSPDDTTNVVVSGIFVLSDSAYSLAAFPDSVRFSQLHGDAVARRNGCSATAARRVAPSTFAAIGGMELIEWSSDAPARVSFQLHKAGDVAYHVRLTFSGERFRGTGQTSGSASHVPAYPDDVIVGRRVGAPDHKPCADSAMVWIRKSKR